MKFKAYIYIIYRKRKLLKPYIISKVIDKTHAIKVIKASLPGRRIEVLTLDKIN